MNARTVLYLDHAAASVLCPEARQAMDAALGAGPGNAGARHHASGAAAHAAIEKARAQVAPAFGASADEIIFTSGATEANNLAIGGLRDFLKEAGRTHIVSSAAEHKSVLAPLAALEREGFTVTLAPVKSCGMVDEAALARAIRPETGLVSVQMVNNELGTIQPVSEIKSMLSSMLRPDILLHTDAAQAPGKMAFSLAETGADLASLSAHKMHGPQGIGALYVRAGISGCLKARNLGGGQEGGLRSGTVPAFLCAGFGAAAEATAAAALSDDRQRFQRWREDFIARLREACGGCPGMPMPIVQGHNDPDWNVPNILSLRFPGIDNEALVMALPGLAFGTGSACGAGRGEHSHVIAAIGDGGGAGGGDGGGGAAARETIRLSFGRFNVWPELRDAADRIAEAVIEISKLKEVA